MKKVTRGSMEPSQVVSKRVTRTPVVQRRAGFPHSLFPLDRIERNTSRSQSCNSWTRRILYELYEVLIFCKLIQGANQSGGEPDDERGIY